MIKVGEPIPSVKGQTQNGPFDIAAFRGSKSVVLWTYPKDATSG
jgi:peroxiredoxin